MQEQNNKSFTVKNIQFIISLIGIVAALAVPFVTYGNKIEAIEKEIDKNMQFEKKVIQSLEDIKIGQAVIKKDIEFIKERLNYEKTN